MAIKSFGISGAFRGITAFGLVLVALGGLASGNIAEAQTFAAQLQSPAPAAPAAVKTIAVTPPTLGGRRIVMWLMTSLSSSASFLSVVTSI